MNIGQIERSVSATLSSMQSGSISEDDFIYELLLAYGHRKQSVSRLRSGERNLATKSSDVIWKRHLYFRRTSSEEIYSEIYEMRKDSLVDRYKIRFIIATNFENFLAIDTRTEDTLEVSFSELTRYFDFFLPWSGIEKAFYRGESPADIKAAEKMAKLFDLLKKENEPESLDASGRKSLNVFLTRLLFCFFAEDTEIFSSNQLSTAIESHTKVDGSDLKAYFSRLFITLDTDIAERQSLPDYLSSFPYVNGSLFSIPLEPPRFSVKSRSMIIECGRELDWSEINPDIFGSMIQAVAHPDQRGGMGMHYTSVPNIMKVIEPLFLVPLQQEFERFDEDSRKLQHLLNRIGEIKILDPACGSGNFLVIAYKELRKIEMEILRRQQEIELEKSGQIVQPFSEVKLSQFFGIETDEFACEVAVLSLWLAEHQMNIEFKAEFGECRAPLPLSKSAHVVLGNATEVDWASVCSLDVHDELYMIGNPPYYGARHQSREQKNDVARTLSSLRGKNNLDYIACWFYIGSKVLSEFPKSKLSFVSTNSITQGVQVSLLWPALFDMGVGIFFAHTSFKWTNSAKHKAGVTCVIIGLEKNTDNQKYLYEDNVVKRVSNITPYLTNADTVFVFERRIPISNLPPMCFGSMPNDGGYLLLSSQEKSKIVDREPSAKKYIRRVYGGDEILHNKERYCIWLDVDNYQEALEVEDIRDRIEKVSEYRLASKRPATNRLAGVPYRFGEVRHKDESFVIMPAQFSENREYILATYMDSSIIATNLAHAIYDAQPYVLGIVSSKMHYVWAKAVAGGLETRIRYSPTMCYNTFPLPSIGEDRVERISKICFELLEVRERYSDTTLADIYKVGLMPEAIAQVHSRLDLEVDACFQKEKFSDDEERLEVLFMNYKTMLENENA